MKKVILFISTLVLFLNSVKAEEYSNWVLELDDSIKYDDVQTETRYRFYKEEIEGEYLINDTLNKYMYNDIENYIYSEFSNWQEVCEVKDSNIENKMLYPYKKLIVDSNYIIIDEVNGGIGFNDIKIFSNGEEILFEIEECDNCVKDYSYIERKDKLILKLEKTVPTKTMTFYLDAKKDYPNVTYRLKTSWDKEVEKTGIVKVANSNLKDFIPSNSWFYYSVESDIMYSETPIMEDDNTVVYPSKNMCRYQEKMAYYYNINKVYYDDNYYTNIDGYIKDINDYKVYYRYLIKDKKEDTNYDINNSINNSYIDTTEKEENISTNETIENITKEDNQDNIEKTTVTNNKNNKETVPIINTMSINKKVPLVKYIILIVIILTLIFIFYQNKKYRKKMSLE